MLLCQKAQNGPCGTHGRGGTEAHKPHGAFSKVKILDNSINRLSYDSSFPVSINAIEFGPTRLLTKGRIFCIKIKKHKVVFNGWVIGSQSFMVSIREPSDRGGGDGLHHESCDEAVWFTSGSGSKN